MTPDRVDRRTLNRTLLARQWLYPRAGGTALEAIAHTVGLQAQDPKAPYVGLWSRLQSFAHDDLSTLLLERRAVRIVTLRSTVHLHTAADARPIRAWTQAATENPLRTSRKAAWAVVDRSELVAAATELLQQAPMSSTALGEALHPRWPEVDPADLHQFARAFLHLVQVPPRGVWGRSGRTTYAIADDWLGGRAPEPDPAGFVARYLAAYGPASVRDVQTWSGLTRLSEVTAGMDLRRYVDEDGVELLDVPGLDLVDGATPVPPVFIAPFDNVTLSHADRRRVIDGEARANIASRNGAIPGMVLLDGMVAATWRAEKATLQVTPFGRLSKRSAAGLTRPGRALLQFLTGEPGEVRVTAP
ncbi:winged helix DNA-binding domain-containing protein [Jatrophihabitans sp. YIM 134969]